MACCNCKNTTNNNIRYYPYYKFFQLVQNGLNWNDLAKNYEIPEEILEEFIGNNVFDPKILSQYQKLSEDFIIKHKDKLDWQNISIFQTLSEKFINENSDDIYWEEIANCNNTLSDKFILDNIELLNLDRVVRHQKLSKETIYSLRHRLDWSLVLEYQQLPEDFLEMIIEDGSFLIDWEALSRHQNLSERFIKKYSHVLNLNLVLKYQSLNPEFREELTLMLNPEINDNGSEETTENITNNDELISIDIDELDLDEAEETK